MAAGSSASTVLPFQHPGRCHTGGGERRKRRHKPGSHGYPLRVLDKHNLGPFVQLARDFGCQLYDSHQLADTGQRRAEVLRLLGLHPDTAGVGAQLGELGEEVVARAASLASYARTNVSGRCSFRWRMSAWEESP